MRYLAAGGAAVLLAAAAGQVQAQSADCAVFNSSTTGGFFPGTGVTRTFALNTGEQLSMRITSLSAPGAALEYEIDTPLLPGIEVDRTYTTAPLLESYVITAGDQPLQDVSVIGGGAGGTIAYFQGTCQFDIASVSALSSAFGPPAGGNTLLITGDNLGAATDVTFGGVSASFTVDSNTQITAVAPAGVLGAVVDVQVIASNGDSQIAGAGDNYLYGAPVVVPTLTEWAMILMGVMLAGLGGLAVLRRRRLA